MTSRLLPFLSMVAAVGIFFAYINPLWNGQIAEAKAAIAANNKALESADAYVKRENELAAQMNAIDPVALARLNSLLPDSVDNVGLVLDLNGLAGRTGLSLASVDVANSAASGVGAAAAAGSSVDPVGAIDLTISAKGTYDALIKFLNGIELSGRLLDVRDLQVTGSDTGVYTYAMTIRLYWLR